MTGARGTWWGMRWIAMLAVAVWGVGCANVLDLDGYGDGPTPGVDPLAGSDPAGCPLGSADCDGDGSCETDLWSSRDDCGACGESCGGEACEQGSCQLTTIVGGVTFSMSVNDESVHVADWANHKIWRVPQTGEPPVAISDVTQQIFPNSVYQDDDHLYWTALWVEPQSGSIQRALFRRPLHGSDSDVGERVWSARGSVNDFAGTITGSAGVLYWSFTSINGGKGAVYVGLKNDLSTAVPIAGSEAQPLALALSTNNRLFWSDLGTPGLADGRIFKFPSASLGIAVTAEAQAGPTGVAVMGEDLYWATSGLVWDEADGTLVSMRWTGGEPVVLAEKLARPLRVAADQTHVYWVEAGVDADARGRLRRVPRGGGEVEDLFTTPLDSTCIALALHGDHIYWSEQGDGLLRLHRRLKDAVSPGN